MSHDRLNPGGYTRGGRTWLAVGRKPYIRLDGSSTELIRWQIKCAKCDVMVEIATPLAGYETSKAFETKHCSEHKLTRAEALASRNAQRNANSQKCAGSK